MVLEMLEEVRGRKGEEWQQEGVGEVWLEDAGEEVGLVGQGEEGEEGEELQEELQELQEEGVAVARKVLFPAPFHGRLYTQTQTLPLHHSHSVSQQVHRLSFQAILTQLIFCPPSWMRMFLAISWTRPTGNYVKE